MPDPGREDQQSSICTVPGCHVLSQVIKFRKKATLRISGRTQFDAPPRIAVLEHASWERPGSYGLLAAERGAILEHTRVDLGAELPPLTSIDGILAMGGPMSVNDPLPWVPKEKDYIRQAIHADIPFFGVCLGAQLLAASLGAPVRRAQPYYGMHGANLTPGSFTDPLFGGLPRKLRVFQWHGEAFDCPPGATHIAGSPGCPNEAFRVGSAAYGVQFHLEVDPELLAEWLRIPMCNTELVDRCGPERPQEITIELADEAVRMQRVARRIFGGWLDLVTARVASDTPYYSQV
jgi:GMP synthase (glutamine-hydrolysing)